VAEILFIWVMGSNLGGEDGADNSNEDDNKTKGSKRLPKQFPRSLKERYFPLGGLETLGFPCGRWSTRTIPVWNPDLHSALLFITCISTHT
jgi:hypothetical protein